MSRRRVHVASRGVGARSECTDANADLCMSMEKHVAASVAIQAKSAKEQAMVAALRSRWPATRTGAVVRRESTMTMAPRPMANGGARMPTKAAHQIATHARIPAPAPPASAPAPHAPKARRKFFRPFLVLCTNF